MIKDVRNPKRHEQKEAKHKGKTDEKPLVSLRFLGAEADLNDRRVIFMLSVVAVVGILIWFKLFWN